MDQFKSYLISEYAVKGYAAVEFRFTHSTNIKIDKKSGVPLRNDVIKVSIKFVDKGMKVLHSSSVSFENNMLTKTQAKKLINISPKELENRFAAAKRDVCTIIMNEYLIKNHEITTKIDDLQKYLGVNGIIPMEFKGEGINVIDSASSTEPKKKIQYEM